MQKNAITVLLFTVAALTALGFVMLFSTSAFAQESHGDIYFFVKRQGFWLGISVAAALVGATIDYHWWRKLWPLFFGGAFVLLLLCFVPGIGMKINGSYRWLNLGIATFQPSELAKLAAIFFTAWWFEKYEAHAGELLKGIIIPFSIVAVLMAPISQQTDLGYTALIGATTLAIMFVGGIRMRWVVPAAIIGVAGILYIATHIDERHGRLMAFMNPEKYQATEGYQQLQGLIAFGSGGTEGLGLGEGRQKMSYLPYAHTDFIFPMIGEELGLKFTLLTVFGYLLMCMCGVTVAMNARDRFGMLLGFGCIMMIILQSIVNIGVTTSLLPNKGMPLPFISFGGSNLAICYFMVGILVNIHRHGNPLVTMASPVLNHVRNYCRL
ncbi:MAG: cell division protein FtsW [Verrucomicrobia bacterium 61-8]|nr:putative lipid II flippase FtsW [Verrucomicrobiota bacterium]OJV16343.1 MAG: cell division protein FtsW [Verrucomicrobia bacterium 61-8]